MARLGCRSSLNSARANGRNRRAACLFPPGREHPRDPLQIAELSPPYRPLRALVTNKKPRMRRGQEFPCPIPMTGFTRTKESEFMNHLHMSWTGIVLALAFCTPVDACPQHHDLQPCVSGSSTRQTSMGRIQQRHRFAAQASRSREVVYGSYFRKPTVCPTRWPPAQLVWLVHAPTERYCRQKLQSRSQLGAMG